MQMLLLQAQSAVLTRRVGVKLKKRFPFGNRFLQGTKRTGLEPATSAVTGLRSNQTELPLLAFGCSLLSVGCEAIIHELASHCKLFFVKNEKKCKNGRKKECFSAVLPQMLDFFKAFMQACVTSCHEGKSGLRNSSCLS